MHHIIDAFPHWNNICIATIVYKYILLPKRLTAWIIIIKKNYTGLKKGTKPQIYLQNSYCSPPLKLQYRILMHKLEPNLQIDICRLKRLSRWLSFKQTFTLLEHFDFWKHIHIANQLWLFCTYSCDSTDYSMKPDKISRISSGKTHVPQVRRLTATKVAFYRGYALMSHHSILSSCLHIVI